MNPRIGLLEVAVEAKERVRRKRGGVLVGDGPDPDPGRQPVRDALAIDVRQLDGRDVELPRRESESPHQQHSQQGDEHQPRNSQQSLHDLSPLGRH